MADFETHYVLVPTQIFVPGSGYITRNLVDSSGIWRRPRAQPFNVVGLEQPRPTEGQIWPRGILNQPS